MTEDTKFKAFYLPPPKEKEFAETKLGVFQEHILAYNKKTVYSHSFFSRPRRVYVSFVPNSVNLNDVNKYPVLFMFHGTDENAYDQELIEQERSKDDKFSWLDRAHRHKFILIFPQSKGRKFERSKIIRWGWEPSDLDLIYVQQVIDDVKSRFGDDNLHPEKWYGIGFSNGGLFSSELILRFDEVFSSFVNYMGGIKRELEKYEELAKKVKRKIPVLIISATRDENLPLCEIAKDFFERNGFQVRFWKLVDIKLEYHAVYSETTDEILKFFGLVQEEDSIEDEDEGENDE